MIPNNDKLNQKPNLLVISPKYPPLKDGLSGHTYQLGKELARDCNVHLLTGNKLNFLHEDHIQIYQSVQRWKFLNLKKQFEQVFEQQSKDLHKSRHKPFDAIIIQYVPTLYGPRGGINFSILLFFLWLRFIKKQNTSFIFHELYYPLLGNWKAIILHLCHKFMLFFSVLSARSAFYSTQNNLKTAKRLSFSKAKHFHLPVGASININSDIQFTDAQNNTYILFGGFHPSKRYDLIFEVFSRIRNYSPKLIVIGTTKDELQKQTPLPLNFDSFASCLGKISDEAVVEVFKTSTSLIAYFSDGLSTRRSSAISALACGLPIITTRSSETEDIFFNHDCIHLLSTKEASFQAQLESLIPTLSASSRLSHDARSFYAENFSWSSIAKLLISRSLSKF